MTGTADTKCPRSQWTKVQDTLGLSWHTIAIGSIILLSVMLPLLSLCLCLTRRVPRRFSLQRDLAAVTLAMGLWLGLATACLQLGSVVSRFAYSQAGCVHAALEADTYVFASWFTASFGASALLLTPALCLSRRRSARHGPPSLNDELIPNAKPAEVTEPHGILHDGDRLWAEPAPAPKLPPAWPCFLWANGLLLLVAIAAGGGTLLGLALKVRGGPLSSLPPPPPPPPPPRSRDAHPTRAHPPCDPSTSHETGGHVRDDARRAGVEVARA